MVQASTSSVTFSPECGENGGRAFVDTQATHPLPPTGFYLTLYKAFLSVSQACCVYTVYWLALALALAVPVLLTLQGQHSSYELGWVGGGIWGTDHSEASPPANHAQNASQSVLWLRMLGDGVHSPG